MQGGRDPLGRECSNAREELEVGRMPAFRLLIKNETGLHARPAALFAETAKQFKCRLTLKHSDRQGDAKSLLEILGLGITKGTEVILEAEGTDAEEALNALKELVAADFSHPRFEIPEIAPAPRRKHEDRQHWSW